MKYLFLVILLNLGLQQTNAQEWISSKVSNNEEIEHKFSVLTTWLTFSNYGNSQTNTQHYELRLSYQLNSKNQIGVKFTTWKLFAPLGIDIWNSKFLDRNYFYPGRLKETGFGFTYQRKLWKGLFATLEVLPLSTKYLDRTSKKIGRGFKLYNSYHLGYHIPLFKKGRFFIEPQFHVNHWPINNNVHEDFKLEEDKWDNYFFIEPNLYFGIKF